jgi:formate dehydrogenase major subunit
VPGLGTSFGRGGATTAQQDLQYADCILIQGSSMAEAHPVGFRWVMKAKQNGAKLIHVDPRFSRTSAMADLWVPIRAGSDIVFLGGLIRFVLEHERFFRDYVVHYTNASCVVKEEYRDAEQGAGYFSGWDPASRAYDPDTWVYEGDDLAHPRRDLTLEHPRCVFQILKRHFARYTPEMVEKATGCAAARFLEVAETFSAASGPTKTAAICYAVGWTQHSTGVQIIRAAAILQLLLGNIGRKGGGIMALRGHASIQGSTDIPTLFDALPGYLPFPRGKKNHDEEKLQDYLDHHTNPTGLWHELPAYTISLLKAWYGRNATRRNEWGWRFLPRVNRDHSHLAYFAEMADGKVEGFFLFGQNPAVGGQHARFERLALSKLKWMVVRDLVETESACWWRSSPEIERGEVKTEAIPTEVFFLPAAGHAEKDGTFTNTQRLLQFHEKAVEPPGDCRSETWFVHQLAKRLIKKARASKDPRDAPLRALDWWYPQNRHGEPDVESVLAEINGWQTKPEKDGEGTFRRGVDRRGAPHHGAQLGDYMELKDDGSTASGCWIYTGVLGPDGENKAKKREPSGRYGHGWGFAWPSDRRVLYNRASADPDGQPWSDEKSIVWWDAAKGEWTGHDTPDFKKDKPPDFEPSKRAKGLDGLAGDAPFLLHEDGLGWLYVPRGLQDGPLPTHFEPIESPIRNPLYARQTNPPVNWFTRADNPKAPPGDPRFPYVLTTFRLTEHHTAGGMSRWLSHLAELQPTMFAEISPELAALLRVRHGEPVTIVTLRGGIEARAMVTRRIRPLAVAGRTVHHVCLPFHWGSAGPFPGGTANDLIGLAGEPNVTIHEGKAGLCNVIRGRMPRGPGFWPWFEAQTSAKNGPRRHPEEPPPGAPSGGHLLTGHGQHGKSHT